MINAQIIGLVDRYRGPELERQLTSANIAWVRSPGVEGTYDGKPVEEWVDQYAARRVFGRELTPGEIGCSLAHVDACRTFLTQGDDWTLILEDDARVAAPDRLVAVLSAVETDLDPNVPQIVMLFARGVVGDIDSKDTDASVIGRPTLLAPYTATAYVINRSAAKEIVQRALPVVSPADWPIATLGTIAYRCVHPWVVAPDVTTQQSTIGKRERPAVTLRQRVQRRARYELRRVSIRTRLHWLRNRRVYRDYEAFVWHGLRRPTVESAMGAALIYESSDGGLTVPIANEQALRKARRYGGWERTPVPRPNPSL